MSEEIKILRKTYTRTDLMDLYYCPNVMPKYLLGFPELVKEDVDNIWYKKPLPIFDDINEGNQRKTNYVANKFKGRQRTKSNQSGDNAQDAEINSAYKYQNGNSKIILKTDKYNRYESQFNKSVNNQRNEDASHNSWKTVESNPYKVNSLSKQYVSNYQGQETHWKQWGKERSLIVEKTSPEFNINEKTNNFRVRKQVPEIKVHAGAILTTCTDQTEDIWQDDWDTEMQSQIVTSSVESSVTDKLPPSFNIITRSEENQYNQISVTPKYTSNTFSDYDLWFYKDLSGIIQGPFPSQSMANWLATGYFDYSTCLRRKCDEKFLLLAEYRALYGRIPFTSGPTISPILKDTCVEIDPIHLAVGVDLSILEKVLTNATSLSSKIPPNIKSNVSLQDTPNNISLMNEMEKQALLEQRKQFEESKAELERARQRFLDEQEQWKVKLEKEMESRMNNLILQQKKEINKTFFEVSLSENEEVDYDSTKDNTIQSDIIISPIQVKDEEVKGEEVKVEEVIVEEVKVEEVKVEEVKVEEVKVEKVKATTSKALSIQKSEMVLHLEDLKGDDWLSTKGIKNKKNKNAKNKIAKQSPELPVVNKPEVKKAEAVKVLKESGSLRIIARDSVDLFKKEVTKVPDTKPNTSQMSWNLKPTILKVEQPKPLKSLVEIQAEESEKERVRRELAKVVQQSQMESDRITSFKESLLKHVKSSPSPVIPVGKSIWDMVEMNDHIIETPETEIVVEKRLDQKPQTDNNNNNESGDDSGLVSWCSSKLSKFKKQIDVVTLVDLLRQVPDEDVTGLTMELLDDSVFSRNFAKDFIQRREVFHISLAKDANMWQTVKKSHSGVPPTTPITPTMKINVTSATSTGQKSSSKKKKKVATTQSKRR